MLVVEDDPVVRELIEWKLAAAGHEVLLAEDGQAGLERAKADKPDVMIVDWMMPKLTGLQVCEAIRADDDLAATPVLLLTARAQESDVDRGYAAGVDDYLMKPFSPRELLTRLEGLTRRSK